MSQTNLSCVCPCEKHKQQFISLPGSDNSEPLLSINQTSVQVSSGRQTDSEDPTHLVDWVTFEPLSRCDKVIDVLRRRK